MAGECPYLLSEEFGGNVELPGINVEAIEAWCKR
jgi:hypothetical protein